ncbi:(Lyso)-N-acylphosphatidylethanolamine lipase-like isoform X1 [Megalops cyprinoides]|uniref:(Lyso)-N-acylphosphatidylethanolamine lipase-like isoform X1 n=1 Tax=Megalops cyprinoides TaxID=118141 RepID=UPI001864DF92|nr:(Lyso)-N-acylphosphatidylethanolamine lipase-like isoform X1 [Megalops cyprinoides]XP_036374831.1 (Lyso)-N-acylphosphatidylethanolamine lipase-like isoform X1 [Megalops cyprinoides]
MIQDYSQTEPESGGGWWLSWTPTSPSLLKSTEARILACVKNDLFARFVTLPNQDEIWTITVTNKHLSTLAQTAPQTPLVLVHGFGGGVGLWIRNLDPLCRSRPVIAFDLLGFGRSARPPFPSDPAQAEEQLVSSIEQWRQVLGLERMILLGHSLGGYLATSYTIQYPERVSHLILADPWGFPEIDQPGSEGSGGEGSQVKRLPGWVKAVASVASFFNPLAVIRAAGPWGPSLLNRIRPDFKRKFEDLFEDDTMTEYIYHCNAQTPSGEVGFRAMAESLGWAKRPMLQRVHLLPPSLPVTLLYGGRSWVDSSTGGRVEQLRPHSYTHTLVIEDASHHVYADQPEEFNRLVLNICDTVD